MVIRGVDRCARSCTRERADRRRGGYRLPIDPTRRPVHCPQRRPGSALSSYLPIRPGWSRLRGRRRREGCRSRTRPPGRGLRGASLARCGHARRAVGFGEGRARPCCRPGGRSYRQQRQNHVQVVCRHRAGRFLNARQSQQPHRRTVVAGAHAALGNRRRLRDRHQPPGRDRTALQVGRTRRRGIAECAPGTHREFRHPRRHPPREGDDCQRLTTRRVLGAADQS